MEGAELGVLMGIPWDRVWIRFILAENVRATQDVAEFLYDQGYVKVYTIAVDDLVRPQTRTSSAHGAAPRALFSPHAARRFPFLVLQGLGGAAAAHGKAGLPAAHNRGHAEEHRGPNVRHGGAVQPRLAAC